MLAGQLWTVINIRSIKNAVFFIVTRNRVAWLTLGFTITWAMVELLVPQAGAPLVEVIWARCAVDVLGMLLFTGLRPERVKDMVRTQHLGRQIGRSFALMGMSLFAIWAIRDISVANMFCLLWGAPLIVLLIDRLFLHEVSGWKIPAITVVGYIGVLLIARPVFTWSWSILPALASVVCLALFIIMTRAMRHEMIMAKMFHAALWATLALTLVMPLIWKTPTLYGWIVLIGVGLFGWLMLYILCRCLETTPSAMFAPAVYGVTVWLNLFEIVRHHEVPGWGVWLGIVIIVGAIITILSGGWSSAGNRAAVPDF